MSYLTVGVGLGELMSALEAGPHMQLATALSLPYNPVASKYLRPIATTIDLNLATFAVHHAKVTLLQKLARLFVLPTLPLVVLANSGSRFSPGLLESIGLYIAFVLVNIWTTAGVQEWLISRRAHKAGAVCAPKVKGKWLGNIDVSTDELRRLIEGSIDLMSLVLQVMRTFISRLPNEIPGTYLDEVLDEMHVNTVHLNVLGGKNYFTRDPAVIKVSPDCALTVHWFKGRSLMLSASGDPHRDRRRTPRIREGQVPRRYPRRLAQQRHLQLGWRDVER